MKKLLIISFMIFISSFRAFATDDKFTKTMEMVLVNMHASKTTEKLQQVANQLERISAAEAKQWLPAYWAAYCYINLSFMEKEAARKDQYLDQADKFLQKAEAIAASNDEILVLKAFVAQARIAIDGQSRYPTYGSIFHQALGQAKQINPENPRIYLLEGQMLYHTPEAFGGGKATACPKLKQAIDLFATFKKASSISPEWGIKYAEHLYPGCGN